MRKDIDLNLRPHPLTGDVVVIKEQKAVGHSQYRDEQFL